MECEHWLKAMSLPTCFNLQPQEAPTPVFAAGRMPPCCLQGTQAHLPQTSHPLFSAAGKVRPECVEGLKRVLGLRRVAWARQVDSMRLMPTSAQMGLIDKRFGGALSKEDVLVRAPVMPGVSCAAPLGDALPWHSSSHKVERHAQRSLQRGCAGEGVQIGPEAHSQSGIGLTRGSCSAACTASAQEFALSKKEHLERGSSDAACEASGVRWRCQEQPCGERQQGMPHAEDAL